MSTLSDNGKQNNENIQPLSEHLEDSGKNLVLKEKWRWVRVGYVFRPANDCLQGKTKCLFKCIQDNFFWVSALVGLFASFLGLFNLWGFTQFVGRSDVFMPSLGFGQELLVVAFSCLISIGIVVGSLVAPSYILTFLLQFFDVTLETVRPIVRMLFCVAVSGVGSFVALSMFFGLGWWSFTAFVIPIALAYFWGGKYVDHTKVSESNRWAKMGLCAGLIVPLAFAMIPNLILSMLYMMRLYESKVVVAGDLDKFAYWLVLSVGSLFPGAFMCMKAKDGVAEKIKYTLIGLMTYVVLLLMIIPKIFGVISAVSMGLLGVSEEKVMHYLIDAKQYPSDSLGTSGWEVKNYDNSYSLNAFSLYEFGAVNLLCPADLSEKDIWEISSETYRCIPFRQDAVRKLGAVVE